MNEQNKNNIAKEEDIQDVSALTGEAQVSGSPVLRLNQVRLNGQTGEFFLVDLLGEKDENGKFKKKNLGHSIEVVLMIHRRKLFQFRKDQRNIESNEYIGKNDNITLYGVNERGTADQLRIKYQGLRTQQIVYALSPKGEVVRLVAKGGSLMSDDKEKNGYYNYINSFDREGKNEHSYQFKTVLTSYSKQNDMGTFWCMDFQRGEALDTDALKTVTKTILDLIGKLAKIENYEKANSPEKIEKEIEASGEPEIIEKMEYPEEDINPEDIPF
jgi:hypothetical protein